MLRCCGDCAFSASFARECTDVSHVAGEGVELTVHKESVVVEEIKEVELRSRRAQFIYDRNYNRNTGSPSAVLANTKKNYMYLRCIS